MVNITSRATLLRLPLLWAVIYLALIPAFALIYMKIGREFYHTTAYLESGRNRDAKVILLELRAAIVDSYYSTTHLYDVYSNGWNGDIRNISVQDLHVNNDEVEFEVRIKLRLERFSMLIAEGTTSYTVKTNVSQDGHTIRDLSSANVKVQKLVSVTKDKVIPFDPNELFPSHPPGGALARDALGKETLLLPISEAAQERLVGFAAAIKGFPYGVPGSFERMLYLSCVTITTLGFGDVLPITTRARMAVSAEAVLGIVVIGFFLNALAYRLSPTSAEGRDPSD